MTIHDRWGDPVRILRYGTLDDVKKIEGRVPDAGDRVAVAHGSYVVLEFADGRLDLSHQMFLRADGGAREVSAALEAIALDVGVRALEVCRPDPDDPERWVYYAAETNSWWSVTRAALVQLGELVAHGMPPGVAYDWWSDADETAIERPRGAGASVAGGA